jgi:hypothetical protein
MGKRRPCMEFNYEKFKDLVHYICHIANRDELGATKLNKILWYSDITSFINHGVPITGSVYVKREFGPVPRDILQVIDELSLESKILIRNVTLFSGKTKREFLTLTEPDISDFTASEISLVASITHDICHHYTAESISDESHDKVWELTGIGEEIPYHAVYGAPLGEIKQEYIEWAKSAIAANETAYDMERFNAGPSGSDK